MSSGHGDHRPSKDQNKQVKAPKGSKVTQKDLQSFSRAQGHQAKEEGKKPPQPK